MKDKIDIIQGDITQQHVEAIVNAANESLLGGGGVDGAIHRAAGPNLLEECRKLNGCETGKAKITNAYLLPCKRVIHTVGPVWYGGNRSEDELLASCYKTCFSFVEEFNIKSMAFPSISTGAYRFPLSRACTIALNETKNFLSKENQGLSKVVFVCFSSQDLKVYQDSFSKLFG